MSAPDQHTHARRWLRYAREDLYIAEIAVRDSGAAPRHACFHAQQAAEKAIKGNLVFAQIDFPRTHDLDLLRGLIPANSPLQSELPDLAALTEWAIDARYPGDWSEPSLQDATAAVAQARAVVDAIVRDLAAHGFVDEEPR